MESYGTFDFDELLNQVKFLFKSFTGRSSKQNESDISNVKAEKYQPPLKSKWYNSGDFSLTGVRPNGRTGHLGVDMRAPGGTSVYPLTSGIVTNVGTDQLGGNIVNIKHPNNITTYYAHLSTVKVFKNDIVNNNTIIGTVGDTGNARHTFPHLHFQVWMNGQIENPNKYFSIPPYTNLSNEEKQAGMWLSDKSRKDAETFNMTRHVNSKNSSFTSKVARLSKCVDQFYKLSLS